MTSNLKCKGCGKTLDFPYVIKDVRIMSTPDRSDRMTYRFHLQCEEDV